MVIFLLISWLTTATAVTPAELEAKLTAIEPYRDQRQAAGAPRLSMTQMKRTADGAVVTGLVEVAGSDTGKGYGAVLYDVPIAVLWSAINDETRHAGYTAVGYSELLAGRACEPGRRVFNYLEVPWVSDRWWIGLPSPNRTIMRNSAGSVRELTFKSSVNEAEITSASAKGYQNLAYPIAFSKGAWFLVAIDARHTYAEYYVWTDPGGRIPASLASSFATKGVKAQIDAIRKFAKEGNPSCPIE